MSAFDDAGELGVYNTRFKARRSPLARAASMPLRKTVCHMLKLEDLLANARRGQANRAQVQPANQPQIQPAKKYFHLGIAQLGPGSVIEPGNMGRLKKRYMRSGSGQNGWGDPWHLARELIFEDVREKQFPHLPSRLGATFVCEVRNDIDAYRAMVDPFLTQIVYEVEIVNDKLPQHVAGIKWTDLIPPGQPFLDTTRFNAAQYWQGTPNGPSELITASPLRVVRQAP